MLSLHDVHESLLWYDRAGCFARGIVTQTDDCFMPYVLRITHFKSTFKCTRAGLRSTGLKPRVTQSSGPNLEVLILPLRPPWGDMG